VFIYGNSAISFNRSHLLLMDLIENPAWCISRLTRLKETLK
jgi:hypothetical protein